VESHGQRRRCRRGPWWHAMRAGANWGPWVMRGGGGCHPRGRGRGRWCGPAGWCHQPPPAAAAAAAAGGQQPTAGAPQPTDNSCSQPAPYCEPATNAETGEMTNATAMADQDWTLVNDGIADVEAAATGVEQLHVSPDDAGDINRDIPGM